MKKHMYSQHNMKTVGIIVSVFLIIGILVIVLTGDQYQEYLGKDEYPNCMKVEEFGGGDFEGCIRHTTTLTPDYQQVYSLSFESFYMNSETNAQNKYQKLLKAMINHQITNQKETKISDTSAVTYFETADHQVWFVVKAGQTLYQAHGIHDEMDKKQKWFDVLRIDYQVPDNG